MLFQASFTSWFPALNIHRVEKPKAEKGKTSPTTGMGT